MACLSRADVRVMVGHGWAVKKKKAAIFALGANFQLEGVLQNNGKIQSKLPLPWGTQAGLSKSFICHKHRAPASKTSLKKRRYKELPDLVYCNLFQLNCTANISGSVSTPSRRGKFWYLGGSREVFCFPQRGLENEGQNSISTKWG